MTRVAPKSMSSSLGSVTFPSLPPSRTQAGDPTSELVEIADSDAPAGVIKYDCTTTPYTLTANPDKIVTLNPDVGKLWLGGLLQGSGYAGGLDR